MLLEVCVTSVESALAAQRGGAQRVELCSALEAGGLTPGYGLAAAVRQALRIGLHLMIRPRGGDFLYSDAEFDVMQREITAAKQLGADGVVFGLLTPQGAVDVPRTRELAQLAHPLHVTFHRAFDRTADPLPALEDVIACGAQTLLTSGRANKATGGMPLIRELVHHAAGRIEIMAGSGVTPDNVVALAHDTGARAFHLSARTLAASRMQYRNDAVSHGGSEYEHMESDEGVIRDVRSLLDALH
jgi:copper homeostasis protein